MEDPDPEPFDVIVVGGGAAGLSASLALGRSRRSVVVIDAGHPRNEPAAHMHGVLGHDGLPPAEYLEKGRAEVAGYGVQFVEAIATGARRRDDGQFVVDLDDGTTRTARRVLVATGLIDELPDIPNLRERWGIDVIHCPYCHGWEVRDTTIGVIATGPMAVHQAMLFRQLSDSVTLFVHAGDGPTANEAERLHARGIRVVPGPVTEVVVARDQPGGRVSGVRVGHETFPVDNVVVGPRMTVHSPVLESLGLEPVAHPMGGAIGMTYEASPTGQTAVAGVWAAGNVVDISASVVNAVGAGYLAGAMINADLANDDTDRALAVHGAHDAHDAPVMDEAFWDARYGTAGPIWSGNPNPQLVADAAELAPGRALDVGAGEGADAIWLAERGWTVDAIDISGVALQRGRDEAAARGADVADRITWLRADVLSDELPAGPYDLVSLQFMHFSKADRTSLFRRCLAVVAPGGTLQVVAHHPHDLHTTAHRPKMPDFFYAADEIAELLDDEWTVVACDARPRTATGPNGDQMSIHDAVLVARRA
jgi:thioredoxin reductase/SAM-dependent methyltransferase